MGQAEIVIVAAAADETHSRWRRMKSTLIPRAFARRPRHDVVFYTPWVGSVLSRNRPVPGGGAETQVLMLAKALARRGMRVGIVAFGAPGELPAEVEGVNIIGRAPYKHHDGLLGKALEALQLWRALWRAPAETLVHRGAGIELGLVAMYARLARRRLVFASASLYDFELRKLLPDNRYLFIYEFGVRLADTIVVQTEEQVELCQRAFGRCPALIRSIAEPADPQREVPDTFLWVGRLVSYKRPLEYLALARALPEARFQMVGVPISHVSDDELVIREVRARAAEIPNLELLPPCPRDEVQALMARAVAAVNTSDFEGMPNVLLEGWAVGAPALALKCDPGGVISTHQLGGFADGSPSRLAELAAELWRTRDSRDEVSRRCRRYILSHHAPEQVAEQWLRLLAAAPEQPGVQLTQAERYALHSGD